MSIDGSHERRRNTLKLELSFLLIKKQNANACSFEVNFIPVYTSDSDVGDGSEFTSTNSITSHALSTARMDRRFTGTFFRREFKYKNSFTRKVFFMNLMTCQRAFNLDLIISLNGLELEDRRMADIGGLSSSTA